MDMTEDGAWVTYAELAKARGITRAAAVKLAQRHKWRRRKGNEPSREVKVLVPTRDMTKVATQAMTEVGTMDMTRVETRDKPEVTQDTTAAFTAALAALR